MNNYENAEFIGLDLSTNYPHEIVKKLSANNILLDDIIDKLCKLEKSLLTELKNVSIQIGEVGFKIDQLILGLIHTEKIK